MKIAIAAAFAALATVATANAAPIQAPVAHARPVEAGASCLNNRPVSHVAYTPDTSMPVKELWPSAFHRRHRSRQPLEQNLAATCGLATR